MGDKQTLHLPAPFILQVGERREKLKTSGYLELTHSRTFLYGQREPFDPPPPVVSAHQQFRLYVGDKLLCAGEGWGINEFGRFVRPESGMVELHLDPKLTHFV